MAYTLITSSNGVGIYFDTTSNTICYSTDGGQNYTELVGTSGGYTAAYTGPQIDSGIEIALTLGSNYNVLNTIVSSGNTYYIDGATILTMSNGSAANLPFPLADGISAGAVVGGSQITYSSGVASIVASSVHVPWTNVDNKASATVYNQGTVQFATDAQASAGIATNVVLSPANMAANTVKTLNGASGNVIISGSSGVSVTSAISGGVTTLTLTNTAQGIQPAPSDGSQYVQKNGEWAPFTVTGTLLAYNIIASGGESVLTFPRSEFGNPGIDPEFDLINSAGCNITYDSKYSFCWDSAGYNIYCSGGWTAGEYTLKTRGLPGPAYTLNAITSYDASSSYYRGDLVTSGGQVYQAVAEYVVAGNAPGGPAWVLVVSSGASGVCAVESVNGQIGAVVLSASDVGAFAANGGTIASGGDVIVSSAGVSYSLFNIGSAVNDLNTTISAALANI